MSAWCEERTHAPKQAVLEQTIVRETRAGRMAAGAVNSKSHDENGTQKVEPSVTSDRRSTKLSLPITA